MTRRLRDKDGIPIEKTGDNLILDTCMYELEYQYGHKASLDENAIEENIFSQVGGEENRQVLYEEKIDH